MSDIHDKLKKLLALAEQGHQGEKKNAQALLEALMKKHGVTIDQIKEEKREMHWFKYEGARNSFQRKLLIQVISAVCGRGVDFFKNKKKKNQIGIEVTQIQRLEIDLRYPLYLESMNESMKIAYSAFIHTNNIFPSDEKDQSDAPDSDPEELNRIAMAMLAMKPVKIHRTITTQQQP